jgi:dUTP pyrophosphatase
MKIVNKSNNPLPTYATEGSAGMDIRSNEVCNIPPLGRRLVKTGLYIQLPKWFEAQIRPRSGNALKKGLTVLNSPGTIDSDYRGEIGVILYNASNQNILIDKGDKIAQMVISEYDQLNLVEVEELDETERGAGGFGSTGEK